GSLSIEQNHQLPSLHGLEALTAVGHDVVIYNNLVTDLDGLAGLREIGRDLRLFFNPVLADVSALHGAVVQGDLFAARSNVMLPTCAAMDLAAALLANGWPGNELDICGNAADACGGGESGYACSG
ncbi:MAG: hypothetical protein L0206_18660, partial [Actinobacteria bacterium]|nr:hypothetical protein [Actinomycetota bacterium]